jgi:hypothetical protein
MPPYKAWKTSVRWAVLHFEAQALCSGPLWTCTLPSGMALTTPQMTAGDKNEELAVAWAQAAASQLP